MANESSLKGQRKISWSAQGFTLIELLIVIGVVAVLTAILMPVFASHRTNAKRVMCASNLRQIGVAAMAYVSENEGKLPVIAVNNLGRHNSTRPGLIDLLGEYTSGDMKTFYCTDGLVTYGDQATRADLAVPNNRFHEIGYYWTQSDERPFFVKLETPPRLASFSPTKGVLAMCLHFPGYPAHKNKLNVLFADGHTEQRRTDSSGILLNYVRGDDYTLQAEF